MEHSIKLIDFETVDQVVQVHGTSCGLSLSIVARRKAAEYVDRRL